MARVARNRRRGNIEQRRLRWYAILNVPRDVQKKLRRKRFLKSLETRDEAKAKYLAAPLVAQWKSEIVAVRNKAEAREDARYWREALRNAGSEERRQELLEQGKRPGNPPYLTAPFSARVFA